MDTIECSTEVLQYKIDNIKYTIDGTEHKVYPRRGNKNGN